MNRIKKKRVVLNVIVHIECYRLAFRHKAWGERLKKPPAALLNRMMIDPTVYNVYCLLLLLLCASPISRARKLK